MLRKKIEELQKEYFNLKDEINLEKASGSLSTLCNLRNQFDETFDAFFDQEEIRKKYNDWSYEDDCILFEKSNDDLLEALDEEDLKAYIEFFEGYLGDLNDELAEIRLKKIEQEAEWAENELGE